MSNKRKIFLEQLEKCKKSLEGCEYIKNQIVDCAPEELKILFAIFPKGNFNVINDIKELLKCSNYSDNWVMCIDRYGVGNVYEAVIAHIDYCIYTAACNGCEHFYLDSYSSKKELLDRRQFLIDISPEPISEGCFTSDHDLTEYLEKDILNIMIEEDYKDFDNLDNDLDNILDTIDDGYKVFEDILSYIHNRDERTYNKIIKLITYFRMALSELPEDKRNKLNKIMRNSVKSIKSNITVY